MSDCIGIVAKHKKNQVLVLGWLKGEKKYSRTDSCWKYQNVKPRVLIRFRYRFLYLVRYLFRYLFRYHHSTSHFKSR